MVTAMFDPVKSVGKAKIRCVITKYATIYEVFLQHVPGSLSIVKSLGTRLKRS